MDKENWICNMTVINIEISDNGDKPSFCIRKEKFLVKLGYSLANIDCLPATMGNFNIF